MGKHEKVETNVSLMIVLVIVAISFGTLVELVPLFFSKQTNEPIAGLKPLPALELEGRDIYIREGCNNCHSQMVRPLRAETERYGVTALFIISKRAELLSASEVLDTAAVDEYLQVREAFRQQRWNDIHDGNPPEPDFFDEELFED